MGDTGATGAKGDKGDPGSGGLSSSDFTMQGVINMNSNKVINLPDPQRDNEPVTKRYADTNYLTDSGFVMSDSISMNNHEIIGLNPTPTLKSTWTIKDVRLKAERLAFRWLTLEIRD